MGFPSLRSCNFASMEAGGSASRRGGGALELIPQESRVAVWTHWRLRLLDTKPWYVGISPLLRPASMERRWHLVGWTASLVMGDFRGLTPQGYRVVCPSSDSEGMTLEICHLQWLGHLRVVATTVRRWVWYGARTCALWAEKRRASGCFRATDPTWTQVDDYVLRHQKVDSSFERPWILMAKPPIWR